MSQPKKPEQVALFDPLNQPAATHEEWLLDSPREGPGTMHRDAYVCWRYLLARSYLQSELVAALTRDKDWALMRTSRAILAAIGAQWVNKTPEVRRASDGREYPDYRLTARPYENATTKAR